MDATLDPLPLKENKLIQDHTEDFQSFINRQVCGDLPITSCGKLSLLIAMLAKSDKRSVFHRYGDLITILY